MSSIRVDGGRRDLRGPANFEQRFKPWTLFALAESNYMRGDNSATGRCRNVEQFLDAGREKKSKI